MNGNGPPKRADLRPGQRASDQAVVGPALVITLQIEHPPLIGVREANPDERRRLQDWLEVQEDLWEIYRLAMAARHRRRVA